MSCFVVPSCAVMKWSLAETWNGVGKGWGGSNGSIPGPGEDVIILPGTWGGKVFHFCGGAGLCLPWHLYLCSNTGSLALVAIPVRAEPCICSLSHRLLYKKCSFWKGMIILSSWSMYRTLIQKRTCKTQNHPAHKDLISWLISVCVLCKDHILHFCNDITFHFIVLLQFPLINANLSNHLLWMPPRHFRSGLYFSLRCI